MAIITGGSVVGGVDRQDRRMTLRGYYSFAASGSIAAMGGVAGTFNLVDEAGHAVSVPDNMVVETVTLEGLITPTSGGLATISIGTTQSGKTAQFLALTAFDDAKFVADTPTALTGQFKANGTSKYLCAVIAVANLTAGKFAVQINGFLGD